MSELAEERGGLFPTFDAAARNLWSAIRWLWRKTWRPSLTLLLLLFLAYLTVNLVAGRRLEAELRRLRTAGEPLTLSQAAPPPVPDAENAALLYVKAFQMMRLGPYAKLDEQGAFQPGTDPAAITGFLYLHPGAKPDFAEVKAILAKNEAAFRLLEEASRRPACRFPVNWDKDLRVGLADLRGVSAAGRFLAARALVEAQQGRGAEALRNLAVVVRMANHTGMAQGIASQNLRRISINMAQESLPETVAAVRNESEIRPLYDLLGKEDSGQDELAESLKADRAMGLWIFDHMRRGHWTEVARLDPTVERLPLYRELARGWPIVRHLWEPFFKLDEVYYLRRMREEIALAMMSPVPTRTRYEGEMVLPRPGPWYALISSINLYPSARVCRNLSSGCSRTKG